jgi:hypothetical protein
VFPRYAVFLQPLDKKLDGLVVVLVWSDVLVAFIAVDFNMALPDSTQGYGILNFAFEA